MFSWSNQVAPKSDNFDTSAIPAGIWIFFPHYSFLLLEDLFSTKKRGS